MHMRYDTPFFNEFVIDTDRPAEEINEALKTLGIVGGHILPDGGMLWCATEMNSRENIDFLIQMLKEVVK